MAKLVERWNLQDFQSRVLSEDNRTPMVINSNTSPTTSTEYDPVRSSFVLSNSDVSDDVDVSMSLTAAPFYTVGRLHLYSFLIILGLLGGILKFSCTWYQYTRAHTYY
jgi:hypothetical protein